MSDGPAIADTAIRLLRARLRVRYTKGRTAHGARSL
jgi:hypothetical protein